MVDHEAETQLSTRTLTPVAQVPVNLPLPAQLSLTIDNLRNGLETQAKVYATSVIRFTLEPCNFTLNTFQNSVFTYFKQEQKCECNYRLLKLFREINKAEITI